MGGIRDIQVNTEGPDPENDLQVVGDEALNWTRRRLRERGIDRAVVTVVIDAEHPTEADTAMSVMTTNAPPSMVMKQMVRAAAATAKGLGEEAQA